MSNSDCRQASIHRKTSETDINLFIRLDGSGDAQVDTGIGFFDHMLKSFAKHGMFDLKLNVTGDLIVDCHHTIEDVGIVLGRYATRWENARWKRIEESDISAAKVNRE